ncbi:C45 family autoproteolytic acyltransferase/hydolase [Lysinibacillus fusiformis]|uniref:C45 family autoproteolytic acyltransferase/hydolase n=1 Tax=Lysinibacillus fusiformis TaxID=28031 RepID=UPI00215B52FA|nr:C45 family peptidase [Lysinibacillus fusiformis]MCR8854058.1 C45 family peptidase [Lysinibacillus fusiformis]WKT79385.1 C45 family peptidase [Lysinibacillus fusiformis]
MEELFVGVVELKGSYNDLGLTQSEEIKSSMLFEQLNLLQTLSTNSNSTKAQEILKTVSPGILEELKGIAKGLEMELDLIVKLYSGYDVSFPPMGCTTFINDDYYARNYDFSPELYDARLVFCNPTDGYASVGFSHSVIGRLDGMNERGLVVGLHFVNNHDKEEGFMATTIVRMLLDQCGCIKEAVDLISNIPHGYCYNYSITDPSGVGVVVEASPHKQVIRLGNSLSCTNHFESEILQEKNRREIQGSLKRKEYVNSLLKKKLSPISLYNNFNDGNSPLFFKYYKEYFGTLHTVIYSPKDLYLIIGVGESCEPIKVSLKDYLDGTLTIPGVIKGKININ